MKVTVHGSGGFYKDEHRSTRVHSLASQKFPTGEFGAKIGRPIEQLSSLCRADLRGGHNILLPIKRARAWIILLLPCEPVLMLRV